MPHFILHLNNSLFYSLEDPSIDPDPLVRWPWMDPCWGIVDSLVEGVQVRDRNASGAEMVVTAEPDFLARWSFASGILQGTYPRGEILIAEDGTIYHVTTHKLTEFRGNYCHDLFAGRAPRRIDDIESEIIARTECDLMERIHDELAPHGAFVGYEHLNAAIIHAIRGVELFEVSHAEMDARIDCAVQELARIYQEERTAR